MTVNNIFSYHQFQLPPPLPRPELEATRFQGPFRTDHDYTQMVQKAADVSNILQHLDHCMEYGLPLVLDMETGLADYFGVDGGEANYPTILPLEYKCFEAASHT